jgi:hypothetical protein
MKRKNLLFSILLIVTLFGCKKNEEQVAPKLPFGTYLCQSKEQKHLIFYEKDSSAVWTMAKIVTGGVEMPKKEALFQTQDIFEYDQQNLSFKTIIKDKTCECEQVEKLPSEQQLFKALIETQGFYYTYGIPQNLYKVESFNETFFQNMIYHWGLLAWYILEPIEFEVQQREFSLILLNKITDARIVTWYAQADSYSTIIPIYDIRNKSWYVSSVYFINKLDLISGKPIYTSQYELKNNTNGPQVKKTK